MIEGMVGQGKVVGGDYINGTVSTGYRGDLVVQAGLKRRKLTPAEVSEWGEITDQATSGTGAASAVGKVVASAILPGMVGKMAGAALDATIGSTARPPRTIRVDWTDGKRSLIKLPEKLFTHLTLVLRDRQAEAAVAPPTEAVTAPTGSPPDIAEQIGKLALLRDQGALTEQEFASKKTELLARL